MNFCVTIIIGIKLAAIILFAYIYLTFTQVFFVVISFSVYSRVVFLTPNTTRAVSLQGIMRIIILTCYEAVSL